MKKFRRILGRCALGAFLLAAVYSILVAAGVLHPAPPVVPEGPMFVPELSQEQEERFAEQKKRYGTLFLTVSSAKPFTVTNHAGDTVRVAPPGRRDRRFEGISGKTIRAAAGWKDLYCGGRGLRQRGDHRGSGAAAG